EGILKSDDSLRVYDPNKKYLSTQDGINDVGYFWWGIELAMDHSLTNTVVYLMKQQAAAIAIQGAIIGAIYMPTGVVAGIVAVIIGMIAETISYVDDGYGVWMDFTDYYVFLEMGAQPDAGY
ncbi:hypothetical protein, partial [Desulfosporosinus sp. OT]|uniref:hypothetical protein n=1 Tax=Desulfosporosinus sp. OT TaxID=913865 RepID=UPI000223A03E